MEFPREPRRHYSPPPHAGVGDVDRRLASVTHLGEVVTHAFLFGNTMAENPYGLCEQAFEQAGIKRASFDQMSDVLARELDKAREFLQAA